MAQVKITAALFSWPYNNSIVCKIH